MTVFALGLPIVTPQNQQCTQSTQFDLSDTVSVDKRIAGVEGKMRQRIEVAVEDVRAEQAKYAHEAKDECGALWSRMELLERDLKQTKGSSSEELKTRLTSIEEDIASVKAADKLLSCLYPATEATEDARSVSWSQYEETGAASTAGPGVAGVNSSGAQQSLEASGSPECAKAPIEPESMEELSQKLNALQTWWWGAVSALESQMKTLQTVTCESNARGPSQQAFDSLHSRVAVAESNILRVEKLQDVQDSKSTESSNRLGKIEESVGSLQGRENTTQSSFETLKESVSTMQRGSISLEQSLTALEQSFKEDEKSPSGPTLERLCALEEALGTAQGFEKQMRDGIENKIINIEDDVTQVKQRMADIDAIEALKSKVLAMETGLFKVTQALGGEDQLTALADNPVVAGSSDSEQKFESQIAVLRTSIDDALEQSKESIGNVEKKVLTLAKKVRIR